MFKSIFIMNNMNNIIKDLWNKIFHYEHVIFFSKTLKKIRKKDHLLYHKPKTDNLYVPLQFWFNRDPHLALPIVALENHHVINMDIDFENIDENE